MTAKRRLYLQIVISLSLFFIFILELISDGKRAFTLGVSNAFGTVAMLSYCKRNLITTLFTPDCMPS